MTKDEKAGRFLGWAGIGIGLVEVLATKKLARALGTRRTDVIRAFGAREIATGAGLVLARRTRPWLLARVAGDLLDAAALSMLSGSSRARTPVPQIALAGVGAIAVLDFFFWLKSAPVKPARSSATMTISRSPDEIYMTWNDPASLAGLFGEHFSIHPESDRRSKWTLKARPQMTWHCDLIEDRPGEYVRWRAGFDAPVTFDLGLAFDPAPADRGTAVRLTMAVAAKSALMPRKLLRPLLGLGAFEVLRHFKALVEAGEVPTISKNPSGRRGPTANLI